MKTDYKDTLNLPKTAFPMKANLARKELELLEFWKKNNTYRDMQGKDRSKSYILHDGPPYANGHIHLGHALNKILKDIIVKFKSMKGYYSPYVPGWDCHGLPIEHEVDKKLGNKKKDVTILDKRKLCREYALKFLDIQRNEFKRLGVFCDWESPYITMSHQYEASIVREFGKFVQKGYVLKNKKPVRWCPSCITALAEAEVEYADKESPSIYVKFRIKDSKGKIAIDSDKGTYFVIWTTTPWTLPANMALALHPELMYCLVKTADGELIVARKLLKDCMEKTGYKENEYTVKNEIQGSELEGIVCGHPWINREVTTILGDHVTLEQGTGVVHTAPGHGEEDYEIGLKYGLDVFAPVNEKGCFTEEVAGFAGQHVFKVNSAIIDKLKERKNLLGSEGKTSHSYPHCWRCKKPVIFRATEQWFISMDIHDLRQNALAEINNVKWIPAWGEDRIYGMVENRPDWCISRQRSWGVPITLFSCSKCKEIITDAAVTEKIVKEVEKAGADVWFEKSEKELITDGFTCNGCGSHEFIKETDILDVWFDSGVSHAAVLETDNRLSWPADMYLEGSDQHRGWFQSSLLTSTGTRGKAPYKSVLTHGFVVDGQGKKMSKSIGNVISPQEVTDKHGAEILRLWSASADYREDMRISGEIIDRLVEAYRKIRNTCRFLLGNLHDYDFSYFNDADNEQWVKKGLLEIDRLALSMLQNLIQKVTSAYERLEFHEVFHTLYNFCVINMSSFYLDVLKDRLYTYKTDSVERRAAQWVLSKILMSLTKLMAPTLSFMAEEIWSFIPDRTEKSIFLTGFPEGEPEFLDVELEKKWAFLLKIREEVNKSLELKRQEKRIGNSLEAKVTLSVKDDYFVILNNYRSFLPFLFIVSSVDVIKESGSLESGSQQPDENREASAIDGLSIHIEKAEGSKCNRCWNWSITTGKYDNFPDLCERCYGVLKG
jgi:isoleucyl-tRNA synthetase